MKLRYNAWMAICATVLGGVSCDKSEPTATPTEDAPVIEQVEEIVEEPVTGEAPAVPALSAEERAAKLGFAQYLPADTEMVMSYYNAEQSAKQLQALKLYGVIVGGLEDMGADEMEDDLEEEDMLEDEDLLEDEEILEDETVAPDADEADEDDDAILEDEVIVEGEAGPEEEDERNSAWTLLGREVTIALGKTAAEQTGRLLTMNRRMAYFQARAMGRAAQDYARTGNMEEFSATLASELEIDGLMNALVEDPEAGTALLEQTEIPPLYMAFRANEGELEQNAQLVNGPMAMFAMAGEMAIPVEYETGGVAFIGYKLLGAKIAETLEAERASMDETMNPETVDALLAALRKKNLVVVTGTIGDYVVMMIGGDEKTLVLSPNLGESLVALDEMAFVDPYADRDLVAMIYGDQQLLNTVAKEGGGLGIYALGLREGISGGEALGDTRNIEGLLQIIAEREDALNALGGANDFGLVAFGEDGLKIESIGGYDRGSVDWSRPTDLAHLGGNPDNLLFLNIPSNAVYDEALSSYVEAIFETAYAVTMKASGLEIEAPELEQLKQYGKLFDEKFRVDVLGLWEALSGKFAEGIGNEIALVVDLKGSVPAVPGLPQGVVDEGKAPRVTMVAPVEDRSKLAEAWQQMDVRATSLLGTFSEMRGEKIPMQKPISSERDGMTTWFFAFPFFQDDFLPSVTVSDKWFAASTSKTHALDLIAKAADGGEAGDGVEFYVNFNVLSKYADETLTLIDKYAAEIFPNDSALEEFQENRASYKELVEASRDFDSLHWDARKAGDVIRTSVHFKTK